MPVGNKFQEYLIGRTITAIETDDYSAVKIELDDGGCISYWHIENDAGFYVTTPENLVLEP